MLDLSKWLKELTENLVDESVPAHTDAPASSSRESASEPRVKVVSGSGSGKHSVFFHFPKDKDCEIRLRTKMTRLLAEYALAKQYLEQTNLVI